MEDQQSGRKRQIITTLAVLIVIVVIVSAAAIANKKGDTDNTSAVQPPSGSQSDSMTSSESSSSDATASESGYKDGTYNTSGSYGTPGGTESIEVSVTLKDGVVTDSSVTSKAKDAESKEYQSMFVGGYKQYVTGKKINDIHLNRVAGSSLTPEGFNDAIETIQDQAKA